MPLYEGLALGTDKHSVVIEIGNAYTKCGFVHEYSPRAIVRSEIQTPTMSRPQNLMQIKDTDRLAIALKEFIENIYFRYLAVNPKDRKVVVVESLFCPTYFRQTLARVLFQHFDIPALLIVPQHLMPLLTLMLPTALVIDVGYVECSVTPVIEGVTLLDSVQFGPLGSKAIHDRIVSDLVRYEATVKEPGTEAQRPFSEEDKLDEKILEDIKVRTCFVAPFERGQKLVEFKKDQVAAGDIQQSCPKPVRYPVDGSKLLTIPGMVRENACEAMFEICGHESSMATLILEALRQCPRDSRKMLAENIVLIGGTCLLPGFKHRLHAELKALIKSDQLYINSLHFDTFKFHKTPCKENYAAWLGAAILGSTDAITMRAVTREQFLRSSGTIMTDWSEWWPPARVA